MAWRYALVPAEVSLQYWNDTPVLVRNMGKLLEQSAAQGIDLTGGDITVVEIHIFLRKVGTPTDNVTIALMGNPDDLTPTTVLATSAAIAGTAMTTSLVEYTFAFTPYVLATGASYFIVVQRSGAASNSNYYQIASGNTAFPGTWLYPPRRYNGTAWEAAVRTIYFRIFTNALVQTSTQLLNLLSGFGQFFSNLIIDVDSGVTSESYRDGDSNAQYEAEQLMAHGTTNLRRMLVDVDESRAARIYEEPEATEANTYQIYSDGSMTDSWGAIVRNELCQAGVWARLVDVIPPSVDTTFMGDSMFRFIEVTEYDVENDKMIYTARDELDPFEIGRPYDG